MLDRISDALPHDRPVLMIAAVLVMLLVTFLPTLVAVLRRHSHVRLVAGANLLLIWTLIGWLAVLAWAITDVRSGRLERYLARVRRPWDKSDDEDNLGP